jgi:hypothetical protein
MTPLRKTALLAGALYLLTYVSSIPAAMVLLPPILHDPNFILGAGSEASVLWGSLLDVVNALAATGTAVVLFPIVKRQSEAAGLGFVASRVFEAAVILVGVVSLLAVVTLRQSATGAPGVDEATLLITGQSLVAVRDWTFLFGPGLLAAVNALLLGSMMWRSRLVPRWIPFLGLLGAPILIISVIATLFGFHEQLSLTAGIAALPIFFWELLFGLWLVVKGFTPSRITADLDSVTTPREQLPA